MLQITIIKILSKLKCGKLFKSPDGYPNKRLETLITDIHITYEHIFFRIKVLDFKKEIFYPTYMSKVSQMV